jgi:hypothetical protein
MKKKRIKTMLFLENMLLEAGILQNIVEKDTKTLQVFESRTEIESHVHYPPTPLSSPQKAMTKVQTLSNTEEELRIFILSIKISYEEMTIRTL